MSRPSQIRFLSKAAPLYDAVARGMGFPELWECFGGAAPDLRGGLCLDVCTGTGGVALALARRGTRVVGLDLAGGMLRCARRKAEQQALAAHTWWVRMDARRLAFPDASFPLVTCAMALHEMSEPERGEVLAEVRRVAGGRVLVAEYRVPRTSWRRRLFQLRHAFEFFESDDFPGFARRDMRDRLEAAGLLVESPRDAGRYRLWPCRAGAR